MPENNENELMENNDILPEFAPLNDVDTANKQDLVVGIAGAGVILLAIGEIVHIAKWCYKKIKEYIDGKKETKGKMK